MRYLLRYGYSALRKHKNLVFFHKFFSVDMKLQQEGGFHGGQNKLQ